MDKPVKSNLKISGSTIKGVVDKTVKSIEIPQDVIEIRPRAFMYCRNLERIYIPNSVIEIGVSAFSDCKSLEEVTLPSELEKIPDRLFEECLSLRKVTIKENVKFINWGAFVNCPNLTEIVVDENNPRYRSVNGFVYNKKMTILYFVPRKIQQQELIVTDTVETIRERAFCLCNGIERVVLPSRTHKLSSYSFCYCSSLSEISMLGCDSLAVKSIIGCKSLKRIIFSNLLTTIPADFASDCSSLEEISFPEKLKKIDSYAFIDCISLKKITLPVGLRVLGKGAFYGCNALERIDVAPDNKYFTSVDGVLYDKKMESILLYPPSHINERFVIPSSITHLDDEVFHDCKNLKELHFPNYTVINNPVIACRALTAIHIHMKEINGGRISNNAFKYVNKKRCTLYVPQESLQIFREYPAFAKFKDIQGIPMTIDEVKFVDMIEYNHDATVITRIKEHYQKFVSQVEIPDGIKEIGQNAFKGCDNLTFVTFPSSLEIIGSNAFQGCSLTQIVIPEGVRMIGESAFMNCNNLTSVTFPSSLENIGNNAFRGCSLTQAILPEGVRMIGESAFMNCNNLASVTFPSSLENIGNYAFRGCSLTQVVIPEGVRKIGDAVFIDCNNLTTVTFPSTLEIIGNYAFRGCI
jgi:hypothetical protein